jgi:hypothetical protein
MRIAPRIAPGAGGGSAQAPLHCAPAAGWAAAAARGSGWRLIAATVTAH